LWRQTWVQPWSNSGCGAPRQEYREPGPSGSANSRFGAWREDKLREEPGLARRLPWNRCKRAFVSSAMVLIPRALRSSGIQGSVSLCKRWATPRTGCAKSADPVAVLAFGNGSGAGEKCGGSAESVLPPCQWSTAAET